MKKYKDETEKAVAQAKAQMRIAEFLKHEVSFTELMSMTAKAQSQVFNIIALVDRDNRDECVVTDVSQFFYFAIQAFELLEPFTDEQLNAG